MGKLVAIEGIDGCGKTTQIKLLAKWLRENDKKVFLTDEPWKGGLRNIIKNLLISKKAKWNYPEVDALLFAADRKLHIEKEIIPALKKYDFVITDRYYHSSLAYQSAQGLDLKWLIEINKFVRKPDLTIIFDLPVKVAIKRIIKDNRGRLDKFENLKFLEKVRKQYLKLPKILKEKIVIINSNRSKEEISEDVKKVMSRFL